MDQGIAFITGRMVANPKVFDEGTEKMRALFTIAYNRGRGDNRKSSFIDCIAWGKRAEIISDFSKGMGISIHGDLEQDVFEKDGKRINRVQVNVGSITATTTIPRSDGGGASRGGSQEEVTVGGEDSADIPF